jgi:hypothetical protein
MKANAVLQTFMGFLAAVVLCDCGSSPGREYLDESTAATIVVANGGWVFARERSDLAIHAQDYITLTPVSVNRSGAKIQYLYCQVWSTIDRRQSDSLLPDQATLTLIADDRTLKLSRDEVDLRKAGFGQPPIAAPNRAAEISLVTIEPEFIRFMAQAQNVRIAMNFGVNSDSFYSWREARNAFIAFADHASPSTPHR